MKPGPEAIAARLAERLPGARIDVGDDSHLHAGHIGARGGAGHYAVTVVTEAFAGLGRIARHRLVYDALADWIPARIHALAVEAWTPAEVAAANGAADAGPTDASAAARAAGPAPHR